MPLGVSFVDHTWAELAPIREIKAVPFDRDESMTGIDYGNYKIFGRIASDIADEEIELGMEMVTAANQLPNGQYNYVFKKVWYS